MVANLLYLLALVLLSPWILYRSMRHGRYRRGAGQKVFGLGSGDAKDMTVGCGEGACVWIHAVSVGEVNLIGGVIKRLELAHPESSIVISTSTDSGYDLATRLYGSSRVFFCPLDFTWAVRRTLRSLNPKLLVLAELELWPNLIKGAKRQGVDVIVINGRLSDRSARGYQRFSRLTAPIFRSVSHVECQDETAAFNFAACGTPKDRIAVSGSLKFDNAPDCRDTPDVQSRCRWAGIDPWHRVWIVGSTQEGEEDLALRVYQSLVDRHPELRLIIVPRHPERFARVAEQIRSRGSVPHRRSSDGSLEHLKWTSDRILLIDTVGELRHWWGVGQIATVGGSFGDRGGQNMLEPAGYGNAISFGPNTKNFAEIAKRLLDACGAVRVHDQAELTEFVERCLTDPPAADSLGRAAKAVVQQHRGATDRTVRAIQRLLAKSVPSHQRAA